MIKVREKGNDAVLSELSGRGDDLLIRTHEMYAGITTLGVHIFKCFQILHLFRVQVTYDTRAWAPAAGNRVQEHCWCGEEVLNTSWVDKGSARALQKVALMSTASAGAGAWAWALSVESSEECLFSGANSAIRPHSQQPPAATEHQAPAAWRLAMLLYSL